MKTVSLNVLWNVILVYCVLFVSFSELQQIGGFLRVVSGTPVSSTNKIDCHDITEILLKVALNTIT